jgi:hypothetical protein
MLKLLEIIAGSFLLEEMAFFINQIIKGTVIVRAI